MALVLVWRPVLAAAWVMQPICRVIGAVLGHPQSHQPRLLSYGYFGKQFSHQNNVQVLWISCIM